MNIDARLRTQNNGTAWRDCEAAGRRHRWTPTGHVASIRDRTFRTYRCERCPVRVKRRETRTEAAMAVAGANLREPAGT